MTAGSAWIYSLRIILAQRTRFGDLQVPGCNRARVLAICGLPQRLDHAVSGRRYSYRVPLFLRPPEFRTLYMNRFVKIGDDKALPLGRWWLSHRQRRQFLGVVCEPGGGPIVDGKLNLWTGWGAEPKRGDWGLMREHIFHVLAARDGNVRDTFSIGWLGRSSIPTSNHKPRWCFWANAEAGAARSVTSCAASSAITGSTFCSPHHLVGRFNAHLRQRGFLFSDEAYAVADRSAESKLKALITEATITLEGKGKDVITVPNHLHVMMASNEDWVIPAGEIEHRFVVQEAANDHAQDPGWFEPLYTQMQDCGGLGAMLFDLLNNQFTYRDQRLHRLIVLCSDQ